MQNGMQDTGSATRGRADQQNFISDFLHRGDSTANRQPKPPAEHQSTAPKASSSTPSLRPVIHPPANHRQPEPTSQEAGPAAPLRAAYNPTPSNASAPRGVRSPPDHLEFGCGSAPNSSQLAAASEPRGDGPPLAVPRGRGSGVRWLGRGRCLIGRMVAQTSKVPSRRGHWTSEVRGRSS